MLAREKRFAIRSIAVGLVVAGLVAALCTWQVQQADARLDALRKMPAATPTPNDSDFVPDKPKGWVPLTDIPETFSNVAKAETEADRARDSRWFLSLVTFSTFSLPLVWYFLLDRLREVSGALSGRDKSDSP
jgi:hypothetical protein